MPNRQPAPITIALSPAQVDSVVRAASSGQAPSIATLIASSLAGEHERGNGRSGGRAGADGTAGGTRRRRAGAKATSDLRSAAELIGDADDARLSRSLLRGFALLAGFGTDGRERGIVELANDLGMSPSTAHRYALTLVELGLLERCPKTRKYRLPLAG